MNDKELNELNEYNQEYIDARLSEDVFGGNYTSEVELKYLQKDYDKLQSNWSSLREWLEKVSQEEPMPRTEHFNWVYNNVLDYMNELEREKDNV